MRKYLITGVVTLCTFVFAQSSAIAQLPPSPDLKGQYVCAFDMTADPDVTCANWLSTFAGAENVQNALEGTIVGVDVACNDNGGFTLEMELTLAPVVESVRESHGEFGMRFRYEYGRLPDARTGVASDGYAYGRPGPYGPVTTTETSKNRTYDVGSTGSAWSHAAITGDSLCDASVSNISGTMSFFLFPPSS